MESLLPTFVITLREGVEAALVVGIVLAYLGKSGQNHFIPWVYGGIGGGVGISILVALGFNLIIKVVGEIAPSLKPLLEAIFGLVAIAMLSWMLIWMTNHSRQLKGELESAVQQSLDQNLGQTSDPKTAAGWAILNLVLFAVLREGFEIVIFITAKLTEPMALVGAIAGLVTSVLFGVGLFQFGLRINLAWFFRTMGTLLLLIVAGLVIGVLGHLDRAIAYTDLCLIPDLGSCVLGPKLWNLATILPQRQFPGIIFHSLFGYTDQLYLGQAIAYVTFLMIAGGIYFKPLTSKALNP